MTAFNKTSFPKTQET